MKKNSSPRPKYGNKKVVVDGYNFDSKAEANYYLMLKRRGHSFMPIAGKYVAMQENIVIQDRCEVPGKKIQAITYRADFVFYDGTEIVKVVDVKGYQDAMSKLKMKMFAFKYGYPVIFAKYNRATDSFDEMSCFESLTQQNQRSKARRDKKAAAYG